MSAYVDELREVVVYTAEFGFEASFGCLWDISVICGFFFVLYFSLNSSQHTIDQRFHACARAIDFAQNSTCMLFPPDLDKIARRFREDE